MLLNCLMCAATFVSFCSLLDFICQVRANTVNGVSIRRSFSDTPEIKTAPYFITELVDQEVEENEAISMTCQVSEPGKSATWFKDQGKIDESERCQMQADSDTFTLTLSKSEVSDAGEYTVRVENIQSSANLIVNGERQAGLKWCMIHFNCWKFHCALIPHNLYAQILADDEHNVAFHDILTKLIRSESSVHGSSGRPRRPGGRICHLHLRIVQTKPTRLLVQRRF